MSQPSLAEDLVGQMPKVNSCHERCIVRVAKEATSEVAIRVVKHTKQTNGDSHMRKAVLLAITVAAAAMLASLLPATTQGVVAAAAAAEPPNIIVILTDDQRVGTMQTLPAVRRQIRNKGANYLGVVPTSVCCPARASLLTGNYAHTTRVYSNNLDLGGWPAFNESGSERRTIATALQDAGYETAFIGKYLNYWNQSREGFVPPGLGFLRGDLSGGRPGRWRLLQL